MIVTPRIPYPPSWPRPYPGTIAWKCLSLIPPALWAGKKVKEAAETACRKAYAKGYEQGKGC